jgi:hypothetical protein
MPEPVKKPRGRKPPATGAPVELNSNSKPKATLASLRSPDVQMAVVDSEFSPSPTFDAAYEAHMVRVAGGTWEDAAKACGYPTAMAAGRAVTSYLQRAAAAQSAQHLQEALQTQVTRYEKVLSSWWQLGTTGHDDRAAMVVLRALERIDRILKLTDGDVAVTRETLVISADKNEYVAQLKALTDGKD